MKLENWQNEFLKIHFEPEHERGQVCWCQPKTIVRNKDKDNRETEIIHNEQREVLVHFIEKLIEKTQIEMIEIMSDMARMDPKKCPKCKKDLLKDEKNSGSTWGSYYCPCTPGLVLSVG